MRRPTVLTTKSERRQFREDEFQRWYKIQTKKEDEDTKNNNTTQVSLNGGTTHINSGRFISKKMWAWMRRGAISPFLIY